MIKRVSFIILACFFIFGCTNLPSSKSNNAETKTSTSSVKGALLAQVNNWSIGTVDFKDRVEALKTLLPEEQVQKEFDNRETKLKMLQEIVNFEILAQEAEIRGLDKDRDVVDALKNFKRNFLAQKLLGAIYQDINITNIEIDDFYNRNKNIFREPEERQIKEIVVNSETQAKDILIRLLQGEDFSFLARSYSASDSRSKGGDLGYFKIDQETTSSQKFPNFWKVVLTTDKGKNSSYFKGDDGKYYIIRVEDVKGGQPMPLRDVRENIREHLKGVQANNKKDEIIEAARKKFKVVINEGLVE
ncbi:MAG: peptidyl-prolyl cis-trans isomerase [Candidatus Omnitrophica bacterium]|nr:peptidyl-prolyl cis-trans isomerase [Candidatus Omnitrophota bacterium]MBU2044935.1 peptidyl-prolyl cis-trans isomerase [Candidatus Omnitrophota bacterium]MBU2250706.1 peptidyl-prolyl cis-trans isomerase [Candidatus Omnitrophota bacterium]MBU2473680.1 peptidyl-prolyl cis-trans isomerase [Candidatus Omnitrophota bacterium]